jgi:two-component system NtrC family sensor kinase
VPSPPLRALLVLQLAAAAAAVAVVLLAAGLPLAAGRALGPRELVLLAAGGAAAFVAVGAAVLFRTVAAPVDRMMAAAERLGAAPGDLPVLHAPGEGATPGLARAAVAFERVAGALAEERARLAAKVAELERANRALEDARASLVHADRLAAVGRLAAGIAHEVGNPLGALAGYADLARARLAAGHAAEADDFLGRIGAEAARIDGIVRGLLDFARPAAPALAPVDLAEAVDGAVRLARVQPRFREVAVAVELPEGLPRVVADPGRLAQVVLNLLLNAADAMAGRGRVTVAARAEGGGVVATVSDEGPGFPPADLPRVFDPFFTTKPPGQGTGLGLAVCHGVMESFGGAIAAANGPAGGAVVRLAFRAAGGPDRAPPDA